MSEDQSFEITARAGADCEVNLQSTPGSGAVWRYVPASDLPILVRQEMRPVGEGVGGQAQQVFVFRIPQAGDVTLDFELKRSWEPQVRSRARAVVHVR